MDKKTHAAPLLTCKIKHPQTKLITPHLDIFKGMQGVGKKGFLLKKDGVKGDKNQKPNPLLRHFIKKASNIIYEPSRHDNHHVSRTYPYHVHLYQEID